MAFRRSLAPLPLLGLLSFLLLHPIATTSTSATGIRLGILRKPSPDVPSFREAPAFRNEETCGSADTDRIHIVMTLDANYLRGTMAAVLSILQHSSCPENVAFHFLSARSEPDIIASIRSTFPYLNFKISSRPTWIVSSTSTLTQSWLTTSQSSGGWIWVTR
uniref:Uncharacterized protein n=1 Tax=Nelumbo nucifera TaxID=4432 RepID=A0A822XHE6_NELNU|nr:TPA_asm: hypothetical protein HUJ06_020845 [Nelumbo nucifera]